MAIYTRQGDQGLTGLAAGERLPKTHPRIELLGALDELSCALGLMLAEPLLPRQRQQVQSLQRQLFDLGACIALADGRPWPEQPTRELENWIDAMTAALPPLDGFILPGGDRASATCHLARAVCRRAERWLVRLDQAEPASRQPHIGGYLNRLSDSLFQFARQLQQDADLPELPWHEAPRP